MVGITPDVQVFGPTGSLRNLVLNDAVIQTPFLRLS